MLRRAIVLAVALASAGAAAEPVKLRMGTMAPEGSGWARLMHGSSQQILLETHGAVSVKWYMGGIAGDEFAMIDRIQRGQLDGAALSMGCEVLAPSLHVMRIVGLIQSRDEARYLYGRLRPYVENELAARGLVLLGVASFGQVVAFTRRPVRTFADLAAQRMWVWDRDGVWIETLRGAGFTAVPMSVDQAGHAYDDGKVDGFFSVPAAALVFQWTTQARWFVDLKVGLLPACIVISHAALDALPVDQQNELRASAGRFSRLFEDEGARLDAALTGGLLERQGIKRVTPDESMTSSFLMAARQSREDHAPAAVSKELLRLVIEWLADYRAEHAR